MIPTTEAPLYGPIDDESEGWFVAKTFAYDGGMFSGAAMRIAAKMHLEVDVHMALAHTQAQEREQGGNAGTNVNISAFMAHSILCTPFDLLKPYAVCSSHSHAATTKLIYILLPRLS
jgi:hypothetical protein